MAYQRVRKLVFIHHSVGGHWLAHEQGGLVSALNACGFYVNDITYGWQPPRLAGGLLQRVRNRAFELIGCSAGAPPMGDRTDIGHFYDWFRGPNSAAIMDALYRANHESTVFGDHANERSACPLPNPDRTQANEIVMIKPCYPNSLYRGRGEGDATGGDAPPRGFPADSPLHTVGNCKRIFNDVLPYFRERRDKFFVIITAPPRLSLPNDGKTARAFSDWLTHGWLAGNGYAGHNVMVFDLFNALTGNGAGGDILAYPRAPNDNHPSREGLRKATEEFMAQFVGCYEAWARGRLDASVGGR